MSKVRQVVVCADVGSLEQAGRFAASILGSAEVKSLAEMHRETSVRSVLVYLTQPDYDHLRLFLQVLKRASPEVVIYYAHRIAPTDAAQLGKLVGETRPAHTSVVFEARSAAESVLRYSRIAGNKNETDTLPTCTKQLRESFGLTQTEMAQALGLSLRTLQNWEKDGTSKKPHQLRDLSELWAILKESIKAADISAWLRSKNEAFSGQSPLHLLREGKARDVIAEFRRLQAGEPV